MKKNYVYKFRSSNIMDIRGLKVIKHDNNGYCRIKSGTLILYVKEVRDTESYYKILYVNNGGILSEGFIKKNAENKLVEMKTQLCMYSVSPKRKELECLLSMESDRDYNSYISKLVNVKIKETEDYKKLYNYWKNICYENNEISREITGDRFVNISYDYEKIKKSKKKLHVELIRNFKLYK